MDYMRLWGRTVVKLEVKHSVLGECSEQWLSQQVGAKRCCLQEGFGDIYMFHVHALKNAVCLYDEPTNVHSQIYPFTYYHFSPTCFFHSCYYHQSVL